MKEPDDDMIQRIINLLEFDDVDRVMPTFRDAFKADLCQIVRQARMASGIKRTRPPSKREVLELIDHFIQALEPLAEPGTEAAAYAHHFIFDDATASERLNVPLFLQHVKDVRGMLDTAQEMFARPGRRPGSSERKELDCFLYFFLVIARRYGRRPTCWKDPAGGEYGTGVRAVGPMAEILRIVKDCFPPGFLPASDATLVRAVERAHAAVKGRRLMRPSIDDENGG
jgi:hypothetical protein